TNCGGGVAISRTSAGRSMGFSGRRSVVVVVAVAIVVIPIVRCAEALRRAIVGIARQHVAPGGLRDQPISVLLEQQPRPDVARGRLLHHAVVSLLAPVALLDREARIVG